MNYRKNLKNHNRIVVKIGSTSVAHDNGKINLQKMERYAWVLSDLRNQGKEIILVSSGAIAVGADRLALNERPRDIIGKQVASAVGQAVLMQIYENFFMQYNQKVAQVLLTKDVFDYPVRRRNAKNTIVRLLEMGVIPVVNENDTVATDELVEFADNDTLSAYVCSIADCDLLMILSDIDAMYTKDPNIASDAERIDIVKKVDENIVKLAGGASSRLGTGGMVTKVNAAKIANDAGADMIIASGENPKIIFDIINGTDTGTLFLSGAGQGTFYE